jgi:LytS/YehU family sensor histidine kinase
MKLFRRRFSGENETYKRIGLTIAAFVIISGLALSFMIKIYSLVGLFGFQPTENLFAQCYAVVIVINAFMMFVYETMTNFDNYMANVKVTEALKKEFLYSQLLGLKSQMNPHFLFNSLNTLSSLLHEDNDDAEVFLDHMSKVFRYLLRNNEEKEVALQSELSFLKSYYYLLKARHKEGLEIKIDIEAEHMQTPIPPLTLQMIVENITVHNTISKSNPLLIHIYTWNHHLVITNNKQPKQVTTGPDTKTLKNIMNKFRLMWEAEISITETSTERQITIPLIQQTISV